LSSRICAGSVQQIGRKGQGPNEYPRALPVWSVGGDSSVMVGSPSWWLRWIAGASLPFTAIRVDDKEKRAHMARLAAVSGKTPSPPDSIGDWPATLSPYRSPVVLLASLDGRLLSPRLAAIPVRGRQCHVRQL
jgi:hypothetical protein